jgi:hypothetical protein
MKSRLELIKDYRQKQPLEELARKREKARRRGFWTQEDIDHMWAWAEEMHGKIKQGRLLDDVS